MRSICAFLGAMLACTPSSQPEAESGGPTDTAGGGDETADLLTSDGIGSSGQTTDEGEEENETDGSEEGPDTDDGGGGNTGDASELPVGLHNRTGALACAPDERPPGIPEYPDHCAEGDECRAHADCGDGANGRCQPAPVRGGPCECRYDACTNDADCPEARPVCACAVSAPADDQEHHECVRASCQTADDCESGYCFADVADCFAPGTQRVVGYHCATEHDSCRDDATCTGDNPVCRFDDGDWRCGVRDDGFYCDGE